MLQPNRNRLAKNGQSQLRVTEFACTIETPFLSRGSGNTMVKPLVPTAVSLAIIGTFVACGARSQLPTPDPPVFPDAAFLDASTDRPVDATFDTPVDADASDVTTDPDAYVDVISEPEADVVTEQEAATPDCSDPTIEYIYVITEQNTLMSLYPAKMTWRTIGTINCPGAGSATPFSMGVDRKGLAYVLFNDGNLYRVSTLTAACFATSYVPNQAGFTVFGMGYSTDGAGPSEQLYLAGSGYSGGSTNLGTLDTSLFKITPIGALNSGGMELTGTGDGRLYSFYDTGSGYARIAQLDKTTAADIGGWNISTISVGNGWAFGFWGGDFYTFTAPDGLSTVVNRFDPANQQVTVVATLSGLVVVGAGVSTCAPQQ